MGHKENFNEVSERLLNCTTVGAILIFIVYALIVVLHPIIPDPYKEIVSDIHPLRILLTLGCVLSVTWLISKYILPQSVGKFQVWAWLLALALIFSFGVVIGVTEYVYGGGLENSHKALFGVYQVVAFMGPASFLSIIIFSALISGLRKQFVPTAKGGAAESIAGGGRANGEKNIDISQGARQFWLREMGWSISVLIMLLAIFAFGLEFKPDDKHLTPKWAEIPAILIVFVLAELGMALVIASRDAEEKVQKAADQARAAVDEARAVTNRMEGLERAATATIKTLASKGALSTMPVFLDNWAEHASTLGKPGAFLKTLDQFSSVWIPRHSLKDQEKTGQMLGDFFVLFVGDGSDNGTVRQTSDSVVCITADAVFVDASEEWLKTIGDHAQGRQLVVWALTTLLPTEFAFPSLYRGQDNVGTSRIQTFHRFVSTVLSTCISAQQTTQQKVEYRRVTVFEHEKQFNDLAGTQNDSPNHYCTLDNWLVLDQRVLNIRNPAAKFGTILQETRDLAKLSDTEPGAYLLRRTAVQGLFQSKASQGNIDDRSNILPYKPKTPPSGLHSFEVRSDAGLIDMAVLGSTKEHWEKTVRGKTLQSTLEDSGWQSLRDWYCENLHSSPDSTPGSWWVLLKDEAGALLRDLVVNWGGDEVRTLDLLLIGSRDQNAKDGQQNPRKPTWHGAAISNLSFNRTECTVRLITEKIILEKLEKSVSQLCNNFQVPSQNYKQPEGIVSFGRWETWPEPDWPLKNTARPTEAGTN